MLPGSLLNDVIVGGLEAQCCESLIGFVGRASAHPLSDHDLARNRCCLRQQFLEHRPAQNHERLQNRESIQQGQVLLLDAQRKDPKVHCAEQYHAGFVV